jgi:hypothetical protein
LRGRHRDAGRGVVGYYAYAEFVRDGMGDATWPAYRHPIDGRADLPRVGAVLAGSAPTRSLRHERASAPRQSRRMIE